ncbi:MAG: MBL fold metallo-hydrolase [Erysipelotrichaceae bacterium]|nr:MBL fold metallo-hydrolase [Erysipelotrichaceae bacterium]
MYFTYEFITKKIIRIVDLSKTAVYLILGSEKTILIDTGIGIGDLRDYIRKQFDKEVDEVILTHGHLDHASGAVVFKDLPIHLHENDRELMNRHVFDVKERIAYTEHMYKDPDEVRLLFGKEDVLEGCDSSNTIALYDGQEFDAGDMTLKVIHAPGHTQGMCVILFEEERIILFGDACGVGVLLVEEYCSTVENYLKTLHKLKKYEGDYDRIIRNHGTFESPKELLDNVIEVCEEILDDKDDRVLSKSPIPTKQRVYLAKRTLDGSNIRADGKEGNIFYAENKIR